VVLLFKTLNTSNPKILLTQKVHVLYTHKNMYKHIRTHRLYFDAISGGKDQLELVLKVGTPSHVVFGTDHPFFPPENPGEDWPSTTHVIEGIKTANGGSNAAELMRENAKILLDVCAPKANPLADADEAEPAAKQQKVSE
jgi:predicted TIM-barrel fold metal-dependent hydrolase